MRRRRKEGGSAKKIPHQNGEEGVEEVSQKRKKILQIKLKALRRSSIKMEIKEFR